jgi:hypothetical protein
MNIPDRRQSPRTVLDKIHCIQLGLDNSAIVLNVSDGGLAFHAFQPIPDTREIQFSLSLPNHQRLQGTGELVWRDESKKTAGLRFVSLPAAIREQMRDWGLQGSSVATSESSPVPIPIPSDAVPVAEAGGREPADTSERLPRMLSLLQPEASRAPLLDELRGHYAFDPLTPAEPRSKFLRGFLVGTMVSALALAVVFFVYGPRINDALAQLRESAGLKPGPEQVQAAVAPPVTANPSSSPSSAAAPDLTPAPSSQQAESAESNEPVAPVASAPSSGFPGSGGNSLADRRKPDSDVRGTGDPDGSVSSGPATVASHAPQEAGDTGAKDLAIAQGYLRNRGSAGGSADSAVPFLWSAVGKGNVAAEVMLAELYVRGEGVVRSCDQARVLLYAAASKGSDEADQQLAQIDRARCN